MIPGMRHLRPLLLFALLLPALCAEAKLVDTVNVDIRKYNPELGYFQKAYTDTGDPRFMFTNDRRTFDFGIGGTIRVVGYYGFNGAVNNSEFTPSHIAVPTDYTGQFGTRVTESELHAKIRAKLGKRTLIGYLKIGGTDDNYKISLKQAYLSYAGFSIGKIPSFFMDLEAGPLTVSGKGPNTQIDMSRPLFGYTHRFRKHWSVAASIEQSSLDLDHVNQKYPTVYLYTDYQEVPDVVFKVKYRGEKGHIQLAGLYRYMDYWVSEAPPEADAEGMTRSLSGYGIALSGNYKPIPQLKFSIQSVFGKGISDYLEDLDGMHLNAALKDRRKMNMPLLGAVPVTGGYISAQSDLTKHITLTAVYGYCNVFKIKGQTNGCNLRDTQYIAVNGFWNFTDYAYIGVEYLYGTRTNYVSPSAAFRRGHANRIAMVVALYF